MIFYSLLKRVKEEIRMNEFLDEYKNNRKVKIIAMIPFLLSGVLALVGLFLPYYQVTYNQGILNYGLTVNIHGVSFLYFIGVLLVILACFGIILGFEITNKKNKYYYVFPLIISVLAIGGILLIYFFSKPTAYPDSLGSIKSEGIGIGTILMLSSLGLALLVLILEAILFYKIENGWTGYKSILKLSESGNVPTELQEEDFYDLEEVNQENERLGITEKSDKCPHCGAELRESDSYCPGCGNKIKRQ